MLRYDDLRKTRGSKSGGVSSPRQLLLSERQKLQKELEDLVIYAFNSRQVSYLTEFPAFVSLRFFSLDQEYHVRGSGFCD